MRVELGAPVVLVAGVNALWHLPAEAPGVDRAELTLCGLAGAGYVYGGAIRGRRLCWVCLTGAPAEHTAGRFRPPGAPCDPPAASGRAPHPYRPARRRRAGARP